MLLRFILCCVLLCLSSCGFQLRGSAPLSSPLKRLFVETKNPYGQLVHNLKDYLKTSGVELTDTPKQATTVLNIINESEGQQLLSVSGTQQTRQYNLSLSVTFEVTSPTGAVLVPPITLVQNRTFTTISDQVLGGTNEQAILYQQMRIAIIYDIINRLASTDVTTLLTKQTKKS